MLSVIPFFYSRVKPDLIINTQVIDDIDSPIKS